MKVERYTTKRDTVEAKATLREIREKVGEAYAAELEVLKQKICDIIQEFFLRDEGWFWIQNDLLHVRVRSGKLEILNTLDEEMMADRERLDAILDSIYFGKVFGEIQDTYAPMKVAGRPIVGKEKVRFG